MEKILTVTLNPALDLTTSVERLEAHAKLRCAPPHYDPGGGGVNVSRAIRELGGESCAFIALAGATGEHFRRLLDEEGITYEAWSGHGETRMTFQVGVRSDDVQYRFVLPGPEQSPKDDAALLDALASLITTGGYRYVVASGSLPPGISPDFYARLAAIARERGARLILDTSGPAFEATLPETPFVVKPDRFVARQLLRGGELDEATARDLAADILARRGAEIVIITLGGDGALIATAEAAFRARPPKVDIVSAVGAGDSFIGALTFGLANGWPIEDASRYGVAAAASAVTTEATALLRREQTNRFFEETAGHIDWLPKTVREQESL